jgi:uncharacterized protein YneF (UPF0154 family)
MTLNYDKPPILTYIMLNARNLNTKASIYTKFVFLQKEMTWVGFYIGMPLILLFFIAFGFLLKKYQPQQVKIKNHPINTSEKIIYSKKYNYDK